MKKLLTLSFVATSLLLAQNIQNEITTLKKEIKTLQKEIKENKKLALNADKKINPFYSNDHIFFSYKLRTSFNYIYYKTNTNQIYTNNILSNKITLTGVARPAENLKATLVLSANNIFGMNSQNSSQNIPWVANETPDDTNVRVKEAFFNYHFGPDKSLEFGSGRMPATKGFPSNLIQNDEANPPLSHLINMEFDGFNLQVSNDFLSQINNAFSNYGTWLKFCFGRGYSSSTGKFSPYPYSKDNLKITDFAGFLFIPYDDGQYSIWTETIWAWNLKGINRDKNNDGKIDLNDLEDVGDFFGEDISLRAEGIGNGISDFLDNTTAFIDFGLTKTIPYSNNTMQGSKHSKTGISIWIGAQMPGLKDNDTWGFNYIHGTKYYRPMTYGEDTLIGSIAATRGNAYDLYYNKSLIPHLTTGFRITYINYNYAGSNAFFGEGANPYQSDYINKAYQINSYIKYNF